MIYVSDKMDNLFNMSDPNIDMEDSGNPRCALCSFFGAAKQNKCDSNAAALPTPTLLTPCSL